MRTPALLFVILLALPIVKASPVDLQAINPVTGTPFSESTPLSVCPRVVGPQDVQVLVTNQFTSPITYRLSAEAPINWNASIEQQVILAAGQAMTISFNLTIPHQTPPGLYFVKITGSSVSDPTQKVELRLPVEILGCYGFKITTEQPARFCIESGPVRLTTNITNVGRLSENVSLSATGNGNVSFSQTSFELSPGSTKSVVVTIKPNEAGPQNFTLIATSSHISNSKDLQLDVEDCWRFEADLQPSELKTCLNRTGSLTLTVKNLGRADTFFVRAPTFNRNPAFNYNFTLPENGSREIIFNMTFVQPGSGIFNITVRSGNESQSQYAAAVVEAEECRDIEITAPETSACSGARAVLNISLTNTGTMVDSYDLYVSTGTLSQNKVTLASGEKRSVSLIVNTTELRTAYINFTANNSKISRMAQIPIRVKECWAVRIEPENVTVCECPATFSLWLKNSGLYADNYTILWNGERSQASLEPGQSLALNFNISDCNVTSAIIPLKIRSQNINLQKNITLSIQSCPLTITGLVVGSGIPLWKAALVAVITLAILAVLVVKFAVLVKESP